MALHRYGGGMSPQSVAGVLSMPLRPLVRLVGAAQRSAKAGQAEARRAPPDEEAIIAELNAKSAAYEAKRKNGAA